MDFKKKSFVNVFLFLFLVIALVSSQYNEFDSDFDIDLRTPANGAVLVASQILNFTTEINLSIIATQNETFDDFAVDLTNVTRYNNISSTSCGTGADNPCTTSWSSADGGKLRWYTETQGGQATWRVGTNNSITPNVTELDYLGFKTTSVTTANPGGTVTIKVGGTNVYTHSGANSDTSLWEIVRYNKSSQSFAVYDDGVYQSDITINEGSERLIDWQVGSPNSVGGQSYVDFWHINWTYSDSNNLASNYNITNATINIWNSTLDLVNTTFKDLTGNQTQSNITVWSIDGLLTADDYEWNIEACAYNSSNTFCEINPTNNTFRISNFQINDLIYQGDGMYETENATYILNLTTDADATLFSSFLNYDGTTYLADSITNTTSTDYLLRYELDLPLVNVNSTKNFTFTITLDLGGGFQTQDTDTYFQNVSLANITETQSGLGTTYNFFDEETLTKIYVDIGETIQWYLGSGDVVDNQTFSSNNNTAQRRIIPLKTFKNDAKIRLENSSGYHTRNFHMIDTISGTKRTQNFYLLNSNNGSNIIIEVKNGGLAPLENYLVTIERYYPSTNEYRMVEQQLTDSFGQFSARLIEDTVKYRFTFMDEDRNVVQTIDNVNIACRSTICILPFIISDSTDDFQRFSEVEDYDYTFTFDNADGTFEFTWNDNREGTFDNRLIVERIAFNRTEIVCSTTDDDNFGSLTCDTGNRTGSYRAQIYTEVNGEYRRIDLLNVKIGDESQTYGLEGLFWAFILLFTMVGVGAFNPPIGIIMYLVGLIGVQVLGIAYISPVILIANFVIGVLFIWAFKG